MKISKELNEKILEKSRRDLINSIFGTVFPVIIGTAILLLFSKLGDFFSFIEDGTFCLFSASLFTYAMYMLDNNTELIKKRLDKILHAYSKFIWIIVATVFGLLFAKEKLIITAEIDLFFLWFISIIPFAIAILALYRAFLLEGKAHPPSIEPSKINRGEIKLIADDLR